MFILRANTAQSNGIMPSILLIPKKEDGGTNPANKPGCPYLIWTGTSLRSFGFWVDFSTQSPTGMHIAMEMQVAKGENLLIALLH